MDLENHEQNSSFNGYVKDTLALADEASFYMHILRFVQLPIIFHMKMTKS